MHHTSVKPTLEVEWGNIFSAPATSVNHPTTGLSSTFSKLLKAVMSSVAEAKLGALYINASEAVPMRQLLAEMGHKQPKTPIQTDNTRLRAGSSTTTYNHNAPKQWTCVFTGFIVVTPKDNSDTTGVPESTTEPTTTPNTTVPLTTFRRGQKS